MWNEGIGSSGELQTNDERIKKRHSYRVPWGWKKLPENPNYISPVPKEMQALEQAVIYRDSGDYSWSELAAWLHKVTGRPLSHMGFKHLYLKAKEADNAEGKTAKVASAGQSSSESGTDKGPAPSTRE